MQIDITTHDIKVNPEHKNYVVEKIEALSSFGDRVDDSSTRVKVEIKKAINRTEGKHVECQITMAVPRSILRAEVHANQVGEAIDLAVAKLKKQISRYTSKKHRRDKEGRWIQEPSAAEIPPMDEEYTASEITITRRKRYSNTEPMHEDEAIEQMELIGHNCFIFDNLDTGRFSMIYKKEDGTYGIIEPKREGDLA